MKQSLPVTPNAVRPQRDSERSGGGATTQATQEISELAVVPLADLFQRLHSTDSGLSASDSAAILKTVGPNEIDTAKHKSLLVDFVGRFRNPLVLILLFAAAVAAFTGDVPSFVIIATIVLVSVILEVTQERQAQDAADRLRQQVSLSAKALRDGKTVDVPATQIVPGDVIYLAAGDLVPADARLIEARDLYVDEALLTGEAYPAEKNAAPPSGAATRDAAFPPNLVFMGSSVVSGTAKALLVATGRKAQLGSIASALRKEPPPTAFAMGIQNFGMMIVKATIFLVLFVVLVNIVFHRPLLESFLFALALAVGLTPELLPMIVSVTLAHGAIRLSRKEVIVKRQSAIDDLGAMDVLCSDKTGTLTEARIKLVREVDLGGQDSGSILQMAQLNAAFETGLKSPLDDAILAAGKLDLAAWRKIDEAPFDFERRRVSVLVEGGGRRLIIVKGAPEDILGHSARYEQQGRAAPARRRGARDGAGDVHRPRRRGLPGPGGRMARGRTEPPACECRRRDGPDLRRIPGLPRSAEGGGARGAGGPRQSGRCCQGGDRRQQQVTRHVCGELGLNVAGTLTGPEIASLTDEALLARVDDTTLFCRVTPPLKSRVIATLRRKGHVVGYLGDGINDAPSLHAADVGFSVDTAADVAKEAATMILLRKDLGVLADGVREGRKTFTNIGKYMMMGTSSNFGNMFSMAGGVLFLPFLPMLPTQILLNNLLYDLSETTIPLDIVSDAMTAKPRRWDLDIVRKFMLVFGPISSIFDFATFGLLLWVFHTGEKLFQTGWFVESLATQILVIFIIRTAHPLRDPPHPALVASSLFAVAVAVALPYSPLAHWLGFVAPPAALMGALAMVAIAYLVLVFW